MINRTSINPAQLAEWLAKGEATLIDVREPDEFAAEHIAAAASVPLGGLAKALAALPPAQGRRLVFQCLKGGRGEQARQSASALGYDAYNLAGGIGAWKAAGLPVLGSESKRDNAPPSIFRQVQIGVGFLVLASVLGGFAGWSAGFMMAGLFGTALMISGITGWCGLALLLQRMPWNRA
ncbi:rhodanese-like domain-containing protein [Ancylobacter terrae]|uniref:rhodanese-like domain-containing protein n=1 Tax=Ancylobacter sp. sgz301288 TaxID=3342077 RepID=UPI00385C56D6